MWNIFNAQVGNAFLCGGYKTLSVQSKDFSDTCLLYFKAKIAQNIFASIYQHIHAMAFLYPSLAAILSE